MPIISYDDFQRSLSAAAVMWHRNKATERRDSPHVSATSTIVAAGDSKRHKNNLPEGNRKERYVGETTNWVQQQYISYKYITHVEHTRCPQEMSLGTRSLFP